MAHPPPPTRFTLTRARPADAPRIAEIHLAAMDANPLLHAQFPSPTGLAGLRQFLESEVSEHVASLGDGPLPSSSTEGGSVGEGQGYGGGGISVARDVERGVIVGYIRWDVEVKSDSPGNAENSKAKLESGDIRFVEGCRPEFLEGYATLAEEAKGRCFNESNHYCKFAYKSFVPLTFSCPVLFPSRVPHFCLFYSGKGFLPLGLYSRYPARKYTPDMTSRVLSSARPVASRRSSSFLQPVTPPRLAGSPDIVRVLFFVDPRNHDRKVIITWICLTFVCIDPAWQGRGAGALLTRYVLDLAAADGLPVYLESTEVAVPLYRKLGFRVLDGFEMRIPRLGPADASVAEVGGGEEEGWYREKCMLWTPPSKADGDV